MIEILNDVMSQEFDICLLLLGAFMEQQMKVPFVNSPIETAQLLQNTQSSSAVGVWTLFSLNMMNMQGLLQSRNGGKLWIEVWKYIEGILGQQDISTSRKRHSSLDRGYAGKLQFLMAGMGKTVSCNTKYISYSLERQLSKLCENFNIKPNTSLEDIVNNWDKKFKESILFHVFVGFRPLLARWLLWSLNIHKLREGLASHTTIGIVGLSKSGKSCLVKGLFHQNVISGTTRIQRTTVPFLYNFEGDIDNLSIVDFPGVDDKDKTVVEISKILLKLSQIVVVVIDYRRIATQSAMDWLKYLDQSGVPVLLCLTHGDKLYANECLKNDEGCPINEVAKRIIAKETENIKKSLTTAPNRDILMCSFSQDGDSHLNSAAGRKTLQEIGISLQKDVGDWLIKTLKKQKQNDIIAEKLHRYLEKGHKEYPRQKPPLSAEKALQIPKLLPSVVQYAEKTIKISKGDEHVYLKGYGIHITIPPDALEENLTYDIVVRVVDIKDYKLPSEKAEIVSAFYWIFSSHRFLKEVDIKITHCVKLETKGSTDCMKIIVARCDQPLPYQFQCRNGTFELQSREGVISTKQFSFFSIIREYCEYLTGSVFASPAPAPAPAPDLYYIYKVYGKKTNVKNTWHFDFYFMKDIASYIMAVDDKLEDTGWVEEVPATSFDFEAQSEQIDVVLPNTDNYHGWSIKTKHTPTKISKSHIDRTQVKTTQQCCRIAFRWMRDDRPSPIEFPVDLRGIADRPEVTLSLPIEMVAAESVPFISPRESITIENRPVINIQNTV